MCQREINILWTVKTKDPNITKEQNVKAFDMVEESHDAFSLCDEIRTCP